MLPLPRPQSTFPDSTGFTLLEMITAVSIVGIMCAIALPSFVAIQNNTKLNNSLGILRDALEITQVKASQKQKDELGNTCRVYIPTNQNRIIGNCLGSSSGSSTGFSDSTDAATLRVVSGSSAGSLDGWAVINFDEGVTVIDNSTLLPVPPATLSGNPPRVVYNLQGLTQSTGIIVLGSSYTADRRCLDISAGIGLLRTGKYVNNTCEITE